jgi:putative DNA primase/helicase
MNVGCDACRDDEHQRCYNDKECPCSLDTNHGLTKSGSVNDEGEIIFVNAKHSDDDRIDRVSKSLIEKYNFKTARESNTIYLFTGKIYDNKKAEAIIKEETEKRILECTERDCLEVIAKIKRKTYNDLKDFDSDPNVLILENGILNLQTMELSPHTPTNLSKVLIPCNYIEPFSKDIKENLKDTLFWKFLESSFTINGKVNEESIETVLEIMASVFLKRNIDEKSIMFLGNGENGKSVCLDYLSALLGKDNVSHIPLQVLSEDKFASARLDGKHANIFSDLEKNELRHTGIIKDLSSGEPIHAQQKNKTGFDLYPFAKLIFSTNRFPKSFDQSQGFFRRWIIVKWSRNFENDPDRDDNLKEKLLENESERDIVFSTLIHISRRLLKSNKFTHSKDWKVIQKEWNANADPLDDFIENHIVESDYSKTKLETYQFYKRIMYFKNEMPLGIGKFGKSFSEYFEDSKNDRTRIWLNIDFKEPTQETLEEFDNNE